jgi:hypothetical protein
MLQGDEASACSGAMAAHAGGVFENRLPLVANANRTWPRPCANRRDSKQCDGQCRC